jgi:hypothetical protein
MRKLARLMATAAALAPVMVPVAMSPIGTGTAAGAPAANGGTRVPLNPQRKACDFSVLGNPNQGTVSAGGGEANIRVSGNSVVAEVNFLNTARPNAHYDLGLIQSPRASTLPCGPGSPDTSFVGLDTDAAGRATVTVEDTIHPGTTGAWVMIQRPSPRSQIPAETYTSSFLASV